MSRRTGRLPREDVLLPRLADLIAEHPEQVEALQQGHVGIFLGEAVTWSA